MINNLIASGMPRKRSRRGCIGVLWSSIRYGLPSYAITVKESDRIISKCFKSFFHSMDVHRTFPSEVRVHPYYFLGLNVPEPFIESGMVRIVTFINIMGSETLTSKFITYTLQLFKIKTGQIDDILLQSYNTLQHLAKTCISTAPAFHNRCHI